MSRLACSPGPVDRREECVQYFQAPVLDYGPSQRPSAAVPMTGYDLLWTLHGGDAWRKLAEFEPATEVVVWGQFGARP